MIQQIIITEFCTCAVSDKQFLLTNELSAQETMILNKYLIRARIYVLNKQI